MVMTLPNNVCKRTTTHLYNYLKQYMLLRDAYTEKYKEVHRNEPTCLLEGGTEMQLRSGTQRRRRKMFYSVKGQVRIWNRAVVLHLSSDFGCRHLTHRDERCPGRLISA